MSPVRSVRLVVTLGALTLAAGLVSGCGERVAGEATEAAGFSPQQVDSSTTTAATDPSDPPGSSAIPTPKRLDDVDLCTLMTPDDLEPLGGAAAEPSRDSMLPDSCSYQLAGGAPDDLAVVARYKPIEQVKEQQPDGSAEQTAGYQVWIACETDNGYNSCTAAVAVGQDRTLLTGLSQRDTSTTTVVSRLEALTLAAVQRLPDAS